MKQYIKTPTSIKYKEINSDKYILSANKYKRFDPKNTNLLDLREFVFPITTKNKGNDVGSENYISQSKFKYIKTKAIQDYSYILELNEQSINNIKPQSFINYNLQKGDILIAKDCKVEAIFIDKDYNNYTISSGIYKIVPKNHPYYLFGFLKSEIFQQQIEFMVSRGANRKHAGTLFLDCKISMPKDKKIINFVESIVKAIIEKEVLIKNHYDVIQSLIENEILEHQKEIPFIYKSITYANIINSKQVRIDASLYSKEHKQKEYFIKNYTKGVLKCIINRTKHNNENVYNLNLIDEEQNVIDEYIIKRGQNLQISQIGKSIYSDVPQKSFYTLINPTNISNFGTIEKFKYIGNKKINKFLNNGDIVFGAEGTYRSFVVLDNVENYITNIHGLVIHNKNKNIINTIFLKCYFDFIKNKGLISEYAVGGRGGSFSPEYWNELVIPNFNDDKKKEIASLYYNPNLKINYKIFSIEEFNIYDEFVNKNAGIYELSIIKKHLENLLQKTMEKITNLEEVAIDYS